LLLVILHNPLTIYFMFFNQAASEWVKTTTKIFFLIPAFNFALLYGQISRITCNHFDGGSLMQEKSRTFEWNDLFVRPTGKFHTGEPYKVPSPSELISNMIFNILLYMLVTWYFDHVMPNNRGRTHKYLFFISWSYWFGRKNSEVDNPSNRSRERRSSSVDQYDAVDNTISFKDTVQDEKNQISEDERLNIE